MAPRTSRRYIAVANMMRRWWPIRRPESTSAFARAEPSKHRGQIFRADIEVLAHATPEHRGRHVADAALLLGLVQHMEDDALLASEAVTDVGQNVFDRFHVN